MQRRNNPSAQHNREQLQRELLLRPPKKTIYESLRDAIWNPEERTCLTRTPLNWISITIYYVIFLAGVMLIFFLSMLTADYIASLNHNRPQYILEDSPIGSTPSLNYFPLDEQLNVPLIWLSNNRSYAHYVDVINKIFSEYKKHNEDFNSTQFGECANPPFGYDQKTPCLFFRLNRLILWRPKPYKQGDELPKDVPDYVKQLISSSPTPKIWLSCNGTTAKDRDHISKGILQFVGEKGFDPAPYPFDRQKNFMDPIVVLKINDSEPNRVLYSFTCYAWGKKLKKDLTSVDVTYYFE